MVVAAGGVGGEAVAVGLFSGEEREGGVAGNAMLAKVKSVKKDSRLVATSSVPLGVDEAGLAGWSLGVGPLLWVPSRWQELQFALVRKSSHPRSSSGDSCARCRWRGRSRTLS